MRIYLLSPGRLSDHFVFFIRVRMHVLRFGCYIYRLLSALLLNDSIVKLSDCFLAHGFVFPGGSLRELDVAC